MMFELNDEVMFGEIPRPITIYSTGEVTHQGNLGDEMAGDVGGQDRRMGQDFEGGDGNRRSW